MTRAARPVFAIMDPSTMASLDRRQLANGAVDAFTHVIEQYLTVPVNAPVQYGFSEVLLRTLIEWGPKLVAANSPEARENVMWAANQALNGLIGAGVKQDWSTHMIGHAITALYEIYEDDDRPVTAVEDLAGTLIATAEGIDPEGDDGAVRAAAAAAAWIGMNPRDSNEDHEADHVLREGVRMAFGKDVPSEVHEYLSGRGIKL